MKVGEAEPSGNLIKFKCRPTKISAHAHHFEKTTGGLSLMKGNLAGDMAAQTLLDKSIAAAMAQGSVAAIRTAAAALDKAGNLEDEFVGYTQNFAEFGRKTSATLGLLEQSVGQLRDQIIDVQDQVAEMANATSANGVQIAVIQQVLFDQQSPSVKRSMLESGALPGLSIEQRVTLVKVLDIQIKQQEIVSTITQVVSYARDLKTIMGAFGVKDPGLQRAISYGNVAAQALTQAFSGNYLGAVAAVAGLFGGGSPPDPMAQHMKVIMEAFEGVNKRLEAVMDLQRQTLQAIAVLNNNLNVLRRETHARFDRVDFELAQLRAGQQQIIWGGLQECVSAQQHQDANLIGQPPNTPRVNRYDTTNRRFISFDAMRDYVNSHGDKAYRCAEYLNGIFSSFREPDGLAGNALSLVFAESRLGAHAGVPDAPPTTKQEPELPLPAGTMTVIEYDMPALAYYKSRLYEPSLSVFQHGWLAGYQANAGWGGLANAYAMLTRPSATVRSLHDRIDALNTTSAAEPSKPCQGLRTLLGRRLQDHMCTETTVYLEQPNDAAALANAEARAMRRAQAFLGKPILRDQVGRLMDYALFVAGPRELVRSNGGPYTLAELAASGNDPRGSNLLTRALTVVDVAVAQQSMLYGDMTALFIADLLWDAPAGRFRTTPANQADMSVFDMAKRLLQNTNNPWMRRNVAMIILKRSQRDCDARDQGARCQANNLLYELANDRFFAVKGNKYAPIDADGLAAGSMTLRRAFALHPDARLMVQDQVLPPMKLGEDPPVGIRTLVLALDGFELPLPNTSDWRQGALVYPPLMHDRLADRERIGSRLAGYAAFGSLDASQKEALMTLLANQAVR